MSWFEHSFGEDYKVVYRHRDWEQAAQEVNRMAGWLALASGARVLDVGCGMGRHALAIQRLGYEVTGIDLSEALLREARAHDSEQAVTWVQGDMRRLPFADESFDAAVNLFTSFGYFDAEADNEAVLRQLRRVVKPGGKLLIDYLNPAQVRDSLIPHSERVDEPTGWRIIEDRHADEQWVRKQIRVITQEGLERRYEERVRLLGPAWFEQRLADTGFRIVRLFGDYEGAVYDEQSSPRQILLAEAR